MDTYLLSIALLLAIAWLLLRIRHGKAKLALKKAAESSREEVAYHAVSITFEQHACDAAKAMSGRRFLANAAPRLPLTECNVLECRCKFTHHQDRRANKDRRSPFVAAGQGIGATGSHVQERRAQNDRRDPASVD